MCAQRGSVSQQTAELCFGTESSLSQLKYGLLDCQGMFIRFIAALQPQRDKLLSAPECKGLNYCLQLSTARGEASSQRQREYLVYFCCVTDEKRKHEAQMNSTSVLEGETEGSQRFPRHCSGAEWSGRPRCCRRGGYLRLRMPRLWNSHVTAKQAGGCQLDSREPPHPDVCTHSNTSAQLRE